MATLRFAILKQVGDGDEKVVLEYDQDQILDRLNRRTRENLSALERVTKRKFTKDEIAQALKSAMGGLVAEFKEKTVTIP